MSYSKTAAWHRSLEKKVQGAHLWTGCPAVLSKTPNQVQLVIAKAGSMAHTFQRSICTGEVEPQRRSLACGGEAEMAVIGAVALGHPGARPKACSFFSSLDFWASSRLNILCVPLTCQLIFPSPSSITQPHSMLLRFSHLPTFPLTSP